MTRLLIVVMMLAGAACGPKAKGPAKPALDVAPPTPAEVVTQVKQRVEQYRQGYEVRSVDALAQVYSQTDDLRVTTQGRTSVGWNLVKDQLTQFCAAMQTNKLTLDDVTVISLGDGGAVATAQVRRRYGDGVKTVEETGTLTLVFRRVEKDWKIVAEHYSYAPSSG